MDITKHCCPRAWPLARARSTAWPPQAPPQSRHAISSHTLWSDKPVHAYFDAPCRSRSPVMVSVRTRSRPPALAAAAAELVERTCKRQAISERVTDAVVIAKVTAVLIGAVERLAETKEVTANALPAAVDIVDAP